jgi:hypothetical protein
MLERLDERVHREPGSFEALVEACSPGISVAVGVVRPRNEGADLDQPADVVEVDARSLGDVTSSDPAHRDNLTEGL